MLTPGEIRGRMARIRDGAATEQHAWALYELIGLLHDVLPELAALASGRSLEDAGRRYRDEPERVPCSRCREGHPAPDRDAPLEDWQEAALHIPSGIGEWLGGVCPQCGETAPCERARTLEGR